MKTRNTLAFAFSLVTLGTGSAWADSPARIPAKVGGDAQGLGGGCEGAKKLGMLELRAGRYVEAAGFFSTCLQTGSDDAEVKEALQEAKKHIGTLRILVNETDAMVLIDGEHFWRGLWPEAFLTPGSHRINAKKEGFEPYETVIDVKAGEEQVISIWLLPEGDELYRKVIGIPVQMTFNTKMDPPPEAPTWPGKVMIGGFAGLGLGTAMIVTGVVKASNAKTEEASEAWQGVTIGGGILGGLSVLTLGIGIVGWVTRPMPPTPVILQPVMNNQTTGISMSGQW